MEQKENEPSDWFQSEAFEWFRGLPLNKQQEVINSYTNDELEKLKSLSGEYDIEFSNFMQEFISFVQNREIERDSLVSLLEDYGINRGVAHVLYDETQEESLKKDLQFLRINTNEGDLREISEATVNSFVGLEFPPEDVGYNRDDPRIDTASQILLHFIFPILTENYNPIERIWEIFQEHDYSENEIESFLGPIFEHRADLRWSYSMLQLKQLKSNINNLNSSVEGVETLCEEINMKLDQNSRAGQLSHQPRQQGDRQNVDNDTYQN